MVERNGGSPAGRRVGLLAALAATCGVAAVLPAQAAAIDRCVARAQSQQGARSGVLVLDAATGEVRYAHDGFAAFAPASNMKVLSAAAVLHGLGVGARCATVFRLVRGEVVIDASGDPEWRLGGASDPADVLPRVVAAVRAAGATSVRGVRVERGAFTGPGRPADWPADQRTRDYCAAGGGFVMEDGCLTVELTRGAGGEAAARVVAPPVDAAFRGAVKTKPRAHVWGLRDGGDHVVLHGAFAATSLPTTGTMAVDDPEAWAVRAVRDALVRGGVGLRDDAPALSADLLTWDVPLLPAVQRSLLDSSNFAAEQTLRVLGARTAGDGSLAGGVAAMERSLRDLVGAPSEVVRFVDGSGLSRTNRVTPALLAATLRAMDQAAYGQVFCEALPLAGRTGSLARRFRGTPLEGTLRAKTGWIAGASALSGYLDDANGRRLVFSILMNYDRTKGGRNKHLKKLQEEMCLAMRHL